MAMENSWKLDLSQPIQIILDGPNYVLCAQVMQSFLGGRKLWRYVTGDIPKPTLAKSGTDDSKDITTPTLATSETDDKYKERLDDWESKHHQIITWFHNTSIQSINLQFGRFDSAKSLWDFLAQRYTSSDLSHQYRLLRTLHQLRQEPGQSIADFHSQIQFVWDQLSLPEPTWKNNFDAVQFTFYRDHQRLIEFLMALTDAFEPTRASLLHRHPLPTLDHAVSELISEETRLATLQTQRTDTVLATHSHQSSHQRLFCKFCRQSSHLILHCPIRRCKHCQKVVSGHFNDICPTNPDNRGSSTKPKGAFFKNSNGNQQFSAATADDTQGTVAFDSPSSSFSLHDLESILKQILSKSGSANGTDSWDRP